MITDHLGTPQLAINSQGQQTWKIHSDAFGNTVLDPNNQITLNLRFPGQYYDQETGLSYNYFRDYNPQIGRYIQSDPIGIMGGINTYNYAKGNPVAYMDAYGENPLLPILGRLIAAAVGTRVIARIVLSYLIKKAPRLCNKAMGKFRPSIEKQTEKLAKSFWGRSPQEVAKMLEKGKVTTKIRASKNGNSKATIIEVKNHRFIRQLQIHPGGGRHGGEYLKFSTSNGIIKFVRKSTYKGTEGEKGKIIYIKE